jgi:hypothetical protein
MKITGLGLFAGILKGVGARAALSLDDPKLKETVIPQCLIFDCQRPELAARTITAKHKTTD